MTIGGGSVIVPSVKFESPESSTEPLLQIPASDSIIAVAEVDRRGIDGEAVDAAALDKDLLCPICMQIIKDAFLTTCGHNFCYMCIVTHLQNKRDCPCCAQYLTTNQLFPNFLLNKLLMKASARQMAKGASPVEQVRQALKQGCDASVKELDSLLILLAEKKRKMEQEEAETNMQIMDEFLHCLRRKKLEELNEIQNDLQYIKEDINAVERQIQLHRARERCFVKLRRVTDDSTVKTSWPSLMDKRNSNILESQCRLGAGSPQRKDACSGSDSQNTQAGVSIARKRRVHAQFNELQECYLQKRRHWARQAQQHEERDCNPIQREGYHAGLKDFQSVLSTFTRYRFCVPGFTLE